MSLSVQQRLHPYAIRSSYIKRGGKDRHVDKQYCGCCGVPLVWTPIPVHEMKSVW